jgi:flagellar hook-associated protein 1
MTDLLGIGASGVLAYQSALAAVSDNVANANTPGYTRRSANLVESPTASASSPYYKNTSVQGGVDVAGVTRAWDDFKAGEVRITAADAGQADAKSRWLSAAQGAIDSSDTGVGAKVTAFFTAGDALAADPTSATARTQMLSALGDAANALSTTASGLSRVSDGISTEAQTTVSSVNDALSSLAQINIALHRAGAGTSAAASLQDQRDSLIDSLSANLGVTASFDSAGAATLTLTGTSTTLLDSKGAVQIGMQQATDGRISFSMITPAGDQQAIAPTGGELAGLASAASTVSSRRIQLNGVAADFTASVNGWQAQGVDANGNPGAALLSISGGADTLKLTATDPNAIAAASTDGTANGNLLTLSAPRDSNGAETRINGLVTGLAQQVSSATSEATTTASQRDAALAARDAVSGVDLDKEAADLLRFQQAYSASAKIIQTARDTLQDILQLF